MGKELWKELGGGEKFIHQLRSDWYAKRQKAGLQRAAEMLALTAPLALHATQGKYCPDARGWEVSAGIAVARYTLISVQVRCACSEYGGHLIDNYTVNPKAGQIWQGLEEDGKPLISKRLDTLRKALFRHSSHPG